MKVKLQEGDYVAFCYEEFSDRVGPISLGYELHQLREGKLEQSLIVRGWDRQEIENARFNFVADVTRKKIDTLYTIVDLGYNEFLGIKGHEEDEPENPEADSGQLLWKLKTGSATQASPVSYMLGDKQYVLIPVGASGISRFMVPLYGTADDAKGPSRLIAFTLNGKQSLPEVSTSTMSVPEPPKQTGSKEMIAEGEQLYEVAACGVCHGSTAVGQRSISSSIPDLRYMRKDQHTNFKDTVIKGYRRQMGMLPFDQIINNEQVEAIHAFLIDRQSRLYEAEQQGK